MLLLKFAEQAIDLETLQMLSENDIKDLIPIIGHRAKLTQIKMLRTLSEASNQVSVSYQHVFKLQKSST